jgi:hypothetical protein
MSLYDIAYDGDLKRVEEMLNKGGDPDLSVMGASARQDELRIEHGEEKLEIEYGDDAKGLKKAMGAALRSNPEHFDLYKRLQSIVNLSLERGACFLFSFQQKGPSREASTKKNSFFSRVKMTKGPGDIAKGSFKNMGNK